MSWIRGIQDVSDSFRNLQNLLCYLCDVVLLVEDLLLFVKVDQFLVQRLTQQLATPCKMFTLQTIPNQTGGNPSQLQDPITYQSVPAVQRVPNEHEKL